MQKWSYWCDQSRCGRSPAKLDCQKKQVLGVAIPSLQISDSMLETMSCYFVASYMLHPDDDDLSSSESRKEYIHHSDARLVRGLHSCPQSLGNLSTIAAQEHLEKHVLPY